MGLSLMTICGGVVLLLLIMDLRFFRETVGGVGGSGIFLRRVVRFDLRDFLTMSSSDKLLLLSCY